MSIIGPVNCYLLQQKRRPRVECGPHFIVGHGAHRLALVLRCRGYVCVFCSWNATLRSTFWRNNVTFVFVKKHDLLVCWWDARSAFWVETPPSRLTWGQHFENLSSIIYRQPILFPFPFPFSFPLFLFLFSYFSFHFSFLLFFIFLSFFFPFQFSFLFPSLFFSTLLLRDG